MQTNLSSLERENQRLAFAITSIFYVLLFLLLLFLNAWRITALPNAGSGIELNFGLDNVGSGDIQTRNRPSPLKNKDESQPPAQKKASVVPSQPIEPVTPRPTRTKPVKIEEEPTIASKVESPVKVAEKPVRKPDPVNKPEPRPEPVVKPVEAPPAPPVRQVDTKALYKKGNGASGSNSGGNGTTGSSPNPGGNSNGDDASGVGDKGDPQGKLDAKGLYGNPGTGGGSGGGSGGSSLSLTGWAWTSKPIVRDPSSETGKIVLQISVDAQGDLISVKIIEKTVSQSVAELYKSAVEKLSFVPTNASGARPAKSTGTITFRLNAR